MAEVFPESPLTSLPAAVAAMGALPVPVGPESQPLSLEREQEIRSLDLLALMDDRAAPVISAHLAVLLAEIDRLRAERHSTNEALSDATEALRAARPVEESSAGGFPPALPWLALLDEDDRVEFLDELADSATVNQSSEARLAEIERTCATWRLIAEAQHGHNTAPGPDAVTQVFAPVASLREVSSREEPHDSPLHRDYKGPCHDMPELGGDGRG